MGITMRKKFLLCGHQQEEPYEGRLSRTVLWEGGGEIPLPDPINRQLVDKHIDTKKSPKQIAQQASSGHHGELRFGQVGVCLVAAHVVTAKLT